MTRPAPACRGVPGWLVLVSAAVALTLTLSARAQPPPTTFEEVAARVGIDYRAMTDETWATCAPIFDTPTSGSLAAEYCVPGANTGGATVGDYNGDGLPDLYVLRYDRPALLYENQGDGTFVDVAAEVGVDLAAQVDFAHQQAAGGAVFADVDNDGDEDLYVLTQFTDRFLLFINDGERHGDRGRPHFTEQALERGAAVPGGDPRTRVGMSAAVGDYDRDGWLDLFTSAWSTGTLACGPTPERLLHNLGGAIPARPGSFEDVTAAVGALMVDAHHDGPYGFAPAFVDLDGDGWPDLAVVSDYGTSRLYWNERDGTFADGTGRSGAASVHFAMAEAFGDVDGDGDLDWLISGPFSPAYPELEGTRLLRNDGSRRFVDATDAAGVVDAGWGWGAVFFDMDNDGDLDLFVANGYPAEGLARTRNRVFENRGDGTFRDVTAAVGIADTDQGRAAQVLDYDGDGDLDVFVASYGPAGGKLYRNALNTPGAPPAADYLRVRVVGTVSNRDGRGARVLVTPSDGGATQVREIGTGSHFGGASELVAHFGLGAGFAAAGRTVDVHVTFPSGVEVDARAVAPDQVLTLVEPAGTSLVTSPPVPPPPGDCDGDGAPDFCAPDCDGNGRPDVCDLADGLDADCDGNGVPDACDLAALALSDCDGDGVPDRCAIEADPGLDADGDGRLDACDARSADAGLPDAAVPDAGAADGGA
ncbi:MAG: CRTAC1 family protein, partial [Myxococcales bacterium]|nr:CRTAC1 family protein [Myxococcales bacterium]